MSRTRFATIAAGCALIGLLAGALFSQVRLEFLAPRISSFIETSTGLSAKIAGSVSLSLLPRPHIIIKNVTLRDPEGFVQIASPVLNAQVSLLGLMSAKIEPAALDFQNAELLFTFPQIPKSFEPKAWLKAHPLAMASSRAFPAISFMEAKAIWQETGVIPQTKIDYLSFSLDWSGPGTPAVLSGRAMVRGQKADFQFWVDRPAAVFNGGQSETSLNISVGATKIALNGNISGETSLQFIGREVANVAGIDDIPSFLEHFVLSRCLVPPYSFKSDALVGHEGTTLSNIQLNIGKNQFEGILAYQDNGPRPVLSGTMAVNALRLDAGAESIFGSVQLLNDSLHVIPEGKPLSPCNYDLRLSSNSLQYGTINAENAAFSILSSNDRLDVTLADMKLFGGALSGRFLYGPGSGSQSPQMKLSLQTSNLQMEQAIHYFNGPPLVTGLMSGSMSLEAIGTSFSDIVQHLSGQASIKIDSGSVRGMDIEQILRRMEKRPLAQVQASPDDSTSFDHMNLNVELTNQSANLHDGIVTGPGSHVAFSGSANLIDQTLHLIAMASQPSGDGQPKKDGTHMQIVFDGPWNSMTMTSSPR